MPLGTSSNGIDSHSDSLRLKTSFLPSCRLKMTPPHRHFVIPAVYISSRYSGESHTLHRTASILAEDFDRSFFFRATYYTNTTPSYL